MSDSSQALDRVRNKSENLGLRTPIPSVSQDDASLDFGTAWETVKRHKWLILVTCVLVTSFAAGITMILPKIYASTAVVSVEESRAGEGMSPMMTVVGNRDLSTEIGILENSGELARRVVENVRAGADTSQGQSYMLFAVEEGQPAPSEHELTDRLQEMVSFDTDSEQGLIEIRAESQSPREAAHIAVDDRPPPRRPRGPRRRSAARRPRPPG